MCGGLLHTVHRVRTSVCFGSWLAIVCVCFFGRWTGEVVSKGRTRSTSACVRCSRHVGSGAGLLAKDDDDGVDEPTQANTYGVI